MLQTQDALVNVSLTSPQPPAAAAVDDLIDRYNQQTIELVRKQALIDKLTVQLAAEATRADEVSRQLQAISQSKSWRIGHLVVRAMNVFRRLFGLKTSI